ncbi:MULTISPECIES: glutamine--tRNA ligase/YqeY domain fusion protein [Acinetobacter]|uniref:glutamine--tRNA ligase/YqeY domain fusion protein n=1 Tax=Acinetobacter TaxID=469 RepID=UPI0018A2FDEA|nr:MULTISPECIES: glutamine--tRNA ligase/YqeY domain fusion protein [Acinetobacter]MBF7689552.1 glutamine--tRNA ligase/YqeY domain fusion protein [Acinetobacter pollinis]MBF7692685.1 glutamine--tRNA ligase/YqeY domain fusion protein [Acinetobacter pollinis]MBF7698123.1 glutamine--tRNA ligase/YqeY domain fusion protein [Acinetobacter pollinis]MBF7700625.1 glutamine--tRNA ligase/YqeY domain fusion protein [Acinetobacter pollinis]WEV49774.1 glutamine--tRNA ligase/YqeY domain fusion protein [Acinet
MKPNDVVSDLPNHPTQNSQASTDSVQQEQQPGLDFVRQVITDDLAQGRTSSVVTRFPPEPNGYLHIGHVKAICLNFGVAEEFKGVCNLRFDDTNPDAEEQEYVTGIENDVKWLGFQWDGEARYASKYFDQLYTWAIQLIEQGDAYVDLQSPEEIKLNRGNFVEPGKNSPYRETSVEENLSRFEKMRDGEFGEGKAVLRAKIDMSSPNVHMRDPILYRVLHASHHQTGDKWKIYPMYDYAHPLSDAIEGVTHSLCTLEFQDHRAFYDWVVAKVNSTAVPRQYESSRLNVDYTITSKRKLRRLVEGNYVHGWDDPRMPTVVGMRRRGFTAEGLRDFCKRVGVSKTDGIVDVAMLEFCIRQSLENTAARGMAVLNPLKVTLTNLSEAMDLVHARHPNVDMGERTIPLTSELYIDRSDFEEVPPKGFKRLVPEGEVRLRHAYVIKCDEVVKDANGEVVELKCSIDPDTLGKKPEGRKVKGVIHWVSAEHGLPAEVRIYDRLFTEADPEVGEDFLDNLNKDSLKVVQAIIEPALANAKNEERFQFEREGYFVADRYDHSSDKPVFNRILDLRDSFKPEK